MNIIFIIIDISLEYIYFHLYIIYSMYNLTTLLFFSN